MKPFFYDDDEPIIDRHGRVISLQVAISAPCRYSRILKERAARKNPIHPSALAMYADGNDPREGSAVVSAGGM